VNNFISEQNSRKSCWGITARAVCAFVCVLFLAWMSGIADPAVVAMAGN